MLTWEECLELAILTPEEKEALDEIRPTKTILKVVLSSYQIENRLKRNPCIKNCIILDINKAFASRNYETSACIKAALAQHLEECGHIVRPPEENLFMKEHMPTFYMWYDLRKPVQTNIMHQNYWLG